MKKPTSKPTLNNNTTQNKQKQSDTFDISIDLESTKLANSIVLSSRVISHKQTKEKKVKDVKISKTVKAKERKLKRINNHKKKGSGTTNHNHKKKRTNHPDVVEVTTCAIDVLESKSDLDAQYKQLKDKVLSKLPEPETLVHINQSQTLEERIRNFFDSNAELNTIYLVDLTTVIVKYKDWINVLPNVEPFYAMKCNPDDNIISALVACGAGLDCASMQEMKVALSKGLDGKKIIFANPCKMPAHIKFARENGIEMMTFDNKAELLKVHEIYPNAKMVLRILGDDSHSTMRFGTKFGANVHTEAPPLLEYAYSLGLSVIGVSFHVGSGCQSAEAYTNSLSLARKVFDMAEELGHPMTFLDIGGGTPGVDTEDLKFSEIAQTISRDIKQMFSPDVRVIAEPGRYFASECVVLVTSVIAKRERVIPPEDGSETPGTESKRIDYYISDGVYGSFNNLFFDHAHPSPVPMSRHAKKADGSSSPPRSEEIDSLSTSPKEENFINCDQGEFDSPSASPPVDSPLTGDPSSPCGSPPTSDPALNKSRSTVFGPTCDSIDLICKDVELPDLEIGDIVYFFNMGAYTSAAASCFNGFNRPETVYMISDN